MADTLQKALGAPARFADFPGLDPATELVVCTPYICITEYQGTRAALEAEGVIPAGTVWPDGFDVTGNYPALLPTPGEYAKVIAVDGRRRVASTVAA